MLWWTRKRLESSDPGTRATAAARLGEARDRKAVEALSLALRDPAPEVRRAAATALGRIGDSAAVPALLAGMTDAPRGIQEACAESLGQIGGAAAPALVLFLGDGPVATRKLAARTLAAMGWRPTNRADEVAFAMGATDWDTVARLGGCSVWPLLDVLKKGDDEWRGPAESSLVRIGRAAVPALIEAVESHDGRLQAIAARILGEIRDPEAIAALAAQFLTAGHKAREQMLAALKKIDATWRESGSGRELVHTLTNNLAAPDDRVRSAARDGLIAIRTAPAPALIDLLYSPVAGQVAADVLDSIDAPWTQSDEALRAVPALVAALGGSGGIDSSRCVSLLTKIGARAVAALEHLLTDPEQSTRLEAARVLAHCGDPRALKPVLEAIDAEALCSLAVAGTNANQSALIALACGRGGEAERLGAPAWLAREAGDWRVRVMAADGACALGCDRTMAQRLAADLLAGGSPGIPPYMAQVLRKLAHRAMVSEEIVALAIEALTVGTTMKTFPGDAYGNEYVSMEQGDAAAQKLCAHKEPLATAALELIARLSDITIRVKRCTWSSEETVSFAGRREQASSELRRRKSGG